jgi:hypothetical protein
MSLLLYGCAMLDREGSAQVSGRIAPQSDDEAEQNLAAIRALFQRGIRLCPLLDSSDKRSSESDVYSWPPDWLAAYLSPPRSSEQESDLSSVYVPSSSSSISRPRPVPPDVTVKIPRTTTPYPRSSEAASTRPVPPYTVPAPIGSAFPGSSRCVPDLLGGQRCQAN